MYDDILMNLLSFEKEPVENDQEGNFLLGTGVSIPRINQL